MQRLTATLVVKGNPRTRSQWSGCSQELGVSPGEAARVGQSVTAASEPQRWWLCVLLTLRPLRQCPPSPSPPLSLASTSLQLMTYPFSPPAHMLSNWSRQQQLFLLMGLPESRVLPLVALTMTSQFETPGLVRRTRVTVFVRADWTLLMKRSSGARSCVIR